MGDTLVVLFWLIHLSFLHSSSLSEPYFIKFLYGFQSDDSEIKTYHFKQEPKSKAGFCRIFPIIETEEVNITMIKAARQYGLCSGG
jgi:hypothetical protein